MRRLVRYSGVEFGEAEIEPRTPLETLTRRYGDCKDQAALLVAMLRAVSIPAHVALLKVGEQTDIDPDMPGLNAFDHAIVYVPGKDVLWIDPTAEYAPCGKLPIHDQDRLALVADPHTEKLVRTSHVNYKENCVEETREYVLQKEERGNVRENSRHRIDCRISSPQLCRPQPGRRQERLEGIRPEHLQIANRRLA